ncbi:plasmid stabilization protein ParE [Herbaspirillum sp. VT-16-41]|nr:plasmid stabilization protein ParE [Herbaspirillum sp. VT-16-41]
MDSIWDYSFRQFGGTQADEYIGRIAAGFDVLATHNIGTQRPGMGEDIYSQPVEKHMDYFGSSYAVVTIIRILSQSQDTSRHEPWR